MGLERVEFLAGVDEVGRGPLAGPVVAAAVILDPLRPVEGLRDSKLLTARRRQQLALLIHAQALAVAIVEVDHTQIDRLNILQATLLAMRQALQALPLRATHILIDGNAAPCLPPEFDGCRIETLIGGDALVPCISAASIVAKIHRDALMARMDACYPGYGFADNAGYATQHHRDALIRLGPSPIHRRSFAPVRQALQAWSAPPACTP